MYKHSAAPSGTPSVGGFGVPGVVVNAIQGSLSLDTEDENNCTKILPGTHWAAWWPVRCKTRKTKEFLRGERKDLCDATEDAKTAHAQARKAGAKKRKRDRKAQAKKGSGADADGDLELADSTVTSIQASKECTPTG
ncbi:uncharacterized protein DSM5745_07972 [Aspergillus mulundensis]|uniref:Uncharacterized protein n=1 Tax=Aspergillus mulundensis TaxID=1810919 RepID=A0A3D8R998_9EURO|nr:hypothetical protein DSM5745_07972 [Aspergillus mulundensis]RDW70461.1 hypothetical protein DSM5745_07972 [Aspergillus mulundensis]